MSSPPYPDSAAQQSQEALHGDVLVAIHAPRIAIETVQPSLDHGRFAAKAIVDEPITVTATIFADGHDVLAAAVCWFDDAGQQYREPMHAVRPSGRDHHLSFFAPQSIERDAFTIQAWWDNYGTSRQVGRNKCQVGQPFEIKREKGDRFLVKAIEPRG